METEALNTDEEKPKMRKISSTDIAAEGEEEEEGETAEGTSNHGEQSKNNLNKKKLKFNKVIDAKEEEEKFKQECAQQ